MEIKKIEQITREQFPALNNTDIHFEPVEKGGSGRLFFRFYENGEPNGLFVMQYGNDRPDNARFAPITDFLVEQGIPVPRIHQRCEDLGLLWVDDLGSVDLGTMVEEDWSALRRGAYEAALRCVFSLHEIRESNPPESLPELEPLFDDGMYLWEQEYFFKHYVSNFGQDNAVDLSSDESFSDIRKSLAQEPRSLIHRDFQSSNVMLFDGECYLIDYQGMRWGLPEYDLASLIYDPYVEMAEAEQEHLIHCYFQMKQNAGHQDGFIEFQERLNRCATQRLMQALGAYGNLGLNKGKKEFLKHIPMAENRLRKVAVKSGVLPLLGEILAKEEIQA